MLHTCVHFSHADNGAIQGFPLPLMGTIPRATGFAVVAARPLTREAQGSSMLARGNNATAHSGPGDANVAALRDTQPSLPFKNASFMWLNEHDCDNVTSSGQGYFILARSLCKFKQQ